jgi:hydrogenase nickel incorporation protein HypA/HybF
MHELAIAQSIVDAVEARAAECSATRVKSVRLCVGEASGIVTDSLSFCFEMLTGFYPILQDAQLHIDITPHRARCQRCAREFDVTNFVALCPICKEWASEIVSGTEMQIMEMEVDVA